MTDGDANKGSRHPLQGDGETILVRVEVPPVARWMLMGEATVFSRARFADGTEAGVRLHMLLEVEGQERHGIVEVRTGEVPKGLTMGDGFDLVAGGMVQLHCVVAEP